MKTLGYMARYAVIFLVTFAVSAVSIYVIGMCVLSGNFHWDCVAKCEPYEIRYESSKTNTCICEEAWYDGDGFKQAMRANRR